MLKAPHTAGLIGEATTISARKSLLSSHASSEGVAPVNALRAPDLAQRAGFAEGFGKRAFLTVDVEEEFDWSAPFSREGHTLSTISHLERFQRFCEEIGAHPVYLLDWPVAGDPRAIEIIGDALSRGRADIGAQLHAWVNPPFCEDLSNKNSFAGNLPPELERAKFVALRDHIAAVFGRKPLIFRSGRYGLGPNTAAMLREEGVRIDTSVRSLFDYSAQDGPDFSDFPAHPYWLDPDRSLLELPLTSLYWGPLRHQGRHVHRLQRFIPNFFAGFSRFGLLERLALTPEGVTAEEAIRCVDQALSDGLEMMVLSFHSPSLAPGFTPYCASEADVEALYDWFARIYGHFDKRGVQSARLCDVLQAAR
ncbi:MAG: polysaccharide deacetylase family protein [Pseudomonadota bacterium]